MTSHCWHYVHGTLSRVNQLEEGSLQAKFVMYHSEWMDMSITILLIWKGILKEILKAFFWWSKQQVCPLSKDNVRTCPQIVDTNEHLLKANQSGNKNIWSSKICYSDKAFSTWHLHSTPCPSQSKTQLCLHESLPRWCQRKLWTSSKPCQTMLAL